MELVRKFCKAVEYLLHERRDQIPRVPTAQMRIDYTSFRECYRETQLCISFKETGLKVCSLVVWMCPTMLAHLSSTIEEQLPCSHQQAQLTFALTQRVICCTRLQPTNLWYCSCAEQGKAAVWASVHVTQLATVYMCKNSLQFMHSFI